MISLPPLPFRKCDARRISLAAAALLMSSVPAWPADPIGEWLVEEGYARIKIDNCNDRLWGVVSWEKKPNVDIHNPDPAKRTRPTLGMPVLLGMKATEPNLWEGDIYNSRDGKTYSASVKLKGPDVLQVEGCVLGFLCGSQDWTRVKVEGAAAGAYGSAAAPRTGTHAASRTTNAMKPRGTTSANPATAGEDTMDVCAAVANDANGTNAATPSKPAAPANGARPVDPARPRR